MPNEWRVSIGFAEATVPGEGWLDALSAALPRLGFEPGAIGRLSVETEPDGTTIARDVVTDLEIRLVPLGGPAGLAPAPSFDTAAAGDTLAAEEDPTDLPASPPLGRRPLSPRGPVAPAEGAAVAPPSASAARARADERRDPSHRGAPPSPGDRVPPAAASGLIAPIAPDEVTESDGRVVTPSPRGGALPDDVVEDLFLRLGDISAATGVAAASGIALRILLDLVPAGAGAVLIRTRAGDGLRFRAASGPAAGKLVDTVIPLERGIAGFVCTLGVALSVADARRDRRHDDRVARSTGYTTRAMLAVPVRADAGPSYGCIELLNPPAPFTDRDLEVASRVAASLGAFLHGAYTGR